MKTLSDGSFTMCDYKPFAHIPNNYHLLYELEKAQATGEYLNYTKKLAALELVGQLNHGTRRS